MVSASQDALRASHHSFLAYVLPVLQMIELRAFVFDRARRVWKTASRVSERASVARLFAINRLR